MRHRRLIASAIAALSVVALAACAGPSESEPADEPVELEVWTWLASMPDAAKLFEEANPGITVKVTNLGGDTFTKLQTAMQAGTGGPDVASAQFSELPALVETGGVADIASYAGPDVEGKYVPWTWSQVSPDGERVWAIPQDSGPMTMIYRTDVLAEYGIEVPTTWEEFADAAERLSEDSGGTVKIANFDPTQAAFFYGLVWAEGGQLFEQEGDGWKQTLASPQAIEVAERWGQLIDAGYVSTYPRFAADFADPMNKGLIATSIEAAWGAGNFQTNLDAANAGKYALAPMPSADPSAPAAGNWGGSSTLVTTQSEHPEEAALFADFINSDDAAVVSNWEIDGLFTNSVEGLELPELHDTESDLNTFFGGQDIVQALSDASNTVNTDFQWAPWLANVNTVYAKYMDMAVKGEMSYADAIHAWQDETLKQAQAEGYSVSE